MYNGETELDYPTFEDDPIFIPTPKDIIPRPSSPKEPLDLSITPLDLSTSSSTPSSIHQDFEFAVLKLKAKIIDQRTYKHKKLNSTGNTALFTYNGTYWLHDKDTYKLNTPSLIFEARIIKLPKNSDVPVALNSELALVYYNNCW